MPVFGGKAKEEGKPPSVLAEQIPAEHEVLSEYWIKEPYSRVAIARTLGESISLRYYVDEVRLTDQEIQAYTMITDMIEKEINPLNVPRDKDVRTAVVELAERLFHKYKPSFKELAPESFDRILYYVERDTLGYGPLNSIMSDYRVEDVSCDGVGLPIFVWHRYFESIPTNIIFNAREDLDNFIVRLAHRSGKHVSSAYPILDAMLYGKHRIAASFMDEVSPKGSTFTIRKFRDEPYSIVELMQTGTISPELAAYFWLLLENKVTVIVLGPTGSGKTTFLNALASLVKPGLKIVSVEETAELNIPHKNWVKFISRGSYGLTGTKAGEISIFELVKTSLRYRPDYIVVGEIRGEESFVLFQALATGHGGLSTMHADSLDYAVKRLTSPPMNVAPTHISLMNCAVGIERVNLPEEKSGVSFGRRVREVWEISEFNEYVGVCQWNSATDGFNHSFQKSFLLDKLAVKLGMRREELLEELERRKTVLAWMVNEGIKTAREVAEVISDYYADPDRVYAEVLQAREPQVAPEVDARGELGLLTDEKVETMLLLIRLAEGHGGTVEVDRLLKEHPMDIVRLWAYIASMQKNGHLAASEKLEKGVLKTCITVTEKGRAFLEAAGIRGVASEARVEASKSEKSQQRRNRSWRTIFGR